MSLISKFTLLIVMCSCLQTARARIGSLDTTAAPTAAPNAYSYPSAAPQSGSSGYGYGGSSSSGGSCFAGSETVTLESGDIKLISDVQVGDRVLAANAAGQTAFSDVLFVPHGYNKQSTDFVEITIGNGNDVKMTQNHILPAGVCGSVLPLVYASKVVVGDCIYTVSGEEKVTKIDSVRGEGIYTIVTNEEYIVVNGIIASPFGANHMMANLYYNVHRFLYSLSPALLASKVVHSLNEGMGVFIPLFGSV